MLMGPLFVTPSSPVRPRRWKAHSGEIPRLICPNLFRILQATRPGRVVTATEISKDGGSPRGPRSVSFSSTARIAAAARLIEALAEIGMPLRDPGIADALTDEIIGLARQWIEREKRT
jgi:hypothetical protein